MKSGRDQFLVTGGFALRGKVEVAGAKNSVLKLAASSILAEGLTTITNVPHIADVEIMSELLERLGCYVTFTPEKKTLEINSPKKLNTRADYDLVRKMRASINVLGPLVARFGHAEVALPGGDAIGSRGLDFHINGLVALGANVHIEHGYVIAEAPNGLTGAHIELEFPSVGATENIMTAATLARGTTVIDNAAREPDIEDLGNFLIEMGAHISGLGSSRIEIIGVEKLSPTTHATLPDRIVAGTWAFAAAMSQGDIEIVGGNPDHLELPLLKISESGAIVTTTENGFRVKATSRPQAVDFATLPYPGFPTDLQPMAIALNSVAQGISLVTENVFEGRFMFVNELRRLGANINVDGHHAAITGVEQLSGAPVLATDIRAGAALVLAGLVAEGETIVDDGFHIDRGYPDFGTSLNNLGAQVSRIID
jgi:UDP-N-acetylglucosamine 1-carboxyvinyltransferase